MARPWGTTVTIDDIRFNAHSVGVNFTTSTDRSGLPVMGSLRSSVEVMIDIHDDVNMPFESLKKLFELANVVTRNKIKPVKIELWKDENRQDAICVYAFNGWISNWRTMSSGSGGNHTLYLTLQPAMDKQNYPEIAIKS